MPPSWSAPSWGWRCPNSGWASCSCCSFPFTGGYSAPADFPAGRWTAWGSIKALFLPALALGLIRAAILTRLTRSAMLEVLREDYVRTARAKGLKERTVVYGHALKNAMIPVMTIFGLQMGQLLAGADHHRKCLHPAGTGTAGVPGHRPAGLARGAGGGALHGGRRGNRQLSRRPLLCGR
jgi:hypothetical protein